VISACITALLMSVFESLVFIIYMIYFKVSLSVYILKPYHVDLPLVLSSVFLWP
jgi:lipopolysaccharide transport system permease protein